MVMFSKPVPDSVDGNPFQFFYKLSRDFPIETIERILDFLPVRDILAYGDTNIGNRIQIQKFVRRKTDEEIGRFCMNPQRLRAMLWGTRSIISGSVVLAVLIPYELRDWMPGDMDIYTTENGASQVMNYLKDKEGYKVIPGGTAKPATYVVVGGIREVIKLQRAGGQKIDLIVSITKSAFSPIFKFYGTHVMNVITGRGLLCMYAKYTLGFQALFNLGVLNPNFAALPFDVEKCLVKYTQRGFQFDPHPVIYAKTPHECKKSKCCPHTVRRLYDEGVLVVTFCELPSTDRKKKNKKKSKSAFVPNDLSRVFNGLHQNVWTMGGGPCDLNRGPLMSLGHILLEVKRFR